MKNIERAILIFAVLTLSAIIYQLYFYKKPSVIKAPAAINRVSTVNFGNGATAELVHIEYNNQQCFIFVGLGRIGDMNMVLQCLD